MFTMHLPTHSIMESVQTDQLSQVPGYFSRFRAPVKTFFSLSTPCRKLKELIYLWLPLDELVIEQWNGPHISPIKSMRRPRSNRTKVFWGSGQWFLRAKNKRIVISGQCFCCVSEENVKRSMYFLRIISHLKSYRPTFGMCYQMKQCKAEMRVYLRELPATR
jgi:hypothetical protein